MVITNRLGRTININEVLVEQNKKFFSGWKAADEQISREGTFEEVDFIKSDKYLQTEDQKLYAIGRLYGRIFSFQGLIYLNQEFSKLIPSEVFDSIKDIYV